MINKSLKKKDMEFGFSEEKKVFNILLKKYEGIKQYKDKFSIMDFYLNKEDNTLKYEFELKSRKINHNQFQSLIFGLNKFNHSKKQLEKGIKTYYLFNCEDGLYYWKFKNLEKQKNEFKFGLCGNFKRNDKPHEVVYVYSRYLKKFKI